MPEEPAVVQQLRRVNARLQTAAKPETVNVILWNKRIGNIGSLSSDLLANDTPVDVLARLLPAIDELNKMLAALDRGQHLSQDTVIGALSQLADGLRGIVREHPTLQHRYRLLEHGADPAAAAEALRDVALHHDRRLHSLQESLNELREAVGPELLADVRAGAKEIENVRDAVQKLLAEAGQAATTLKVGDYHRAFRETGGRHRRQAHGWLWTTGILAAVTLVGSIGLLLLAYAGPEDPNSTIGVTVGKGAILLILVSATVWAGLNYRSHLHNAVVNEHRSDALGSYDAFYAAATTPEAKAAVLMQATGAIYAAQPSGFVSHDGDANTSGIGLLGALLAAKGGK